MGTNVAALRARHVDLLESESKRLTEELRGLGAQLIVLFGSYAAGRRDLFTDLDILVVMESDRPFVERLTEVHGRLRPRVATDILVYTPEEFEEMRQQRFVRHALATGKVVHARGQ
jgi:predicted nucleotidyltransferase